jgi:hypothetical protein
MKKNLLILVTLLLAAIHLNAQVEPGAGNWKTWFITSGKDYRLPPTSSYKNEIEEIVSIQKNLDSSAWQQIMYWNAGAPGYRWHDMIPIMADTSNNAVLVLANMLLNVAIYDAPLLRGIRSMLIIVHVLSWLISI